MTRTPTRRNSVGRPDDSVSMPTAVAGNGENGGDVGTGPAGSERERRFATLSNFALWMDRRRMSPKTIRNYTRRIADIEDWLAGQGRPELRRANWRDVRRYADARLPYTYASRQGLRSAIAAYWRYLGRSNSPTWAITGPKKKRGTYRGLDTEEQKDRVLDAARKMSPRDYAMHCALYYQGLRREECATLRWDGIDGRSVRGIGKGGYEYEMPLHPRFAEAVKALEPDGSPYVFPGRWPGTHVSPNTVWMSVRLAGAAAGLGRVTPHMMRHTSISTVLDRTGNARTAAEFARHHDLSTIHVYTRTAREVLVEGMAAL